jgi:hypothetical protein
MGVVWRWLYGAGPYRGYCLLQEDYDTLLETPPDWLVKRYQGDMAVALCRWKLWLEVRRGRG